MTTSSNVNKHPLLHIRHTNQYGKGVFAGEAIKQGSVVYVLAGERMDVFDLVARVNSGKERANDPLQVGRRTYIDLDDVSRTFNHSCDPSLGIRKNSELFALRYISKGEQLTFDYSATIAPTVWKMTCKCGSQYCRKTIGDVRSVPKTQLECYRKAGALQTYMKAVLKLISGGQYRIPKYELEALRRLKKTSEE